MVIALHRYFRTIQHLADAPGASSQKGGVLITSAIASLICLAALLYLAWIPFVNRAALSEATIINISACQSSIQQAPVTSLMWDAFRSRSKTILEMETQDGGTWMKYADVSSLEIFLATPSSNSDFLNPPGPGVDWRKEDRVFGDYVTYTPQQSVDNSAQNPLTGQPVPRKLITSFRDAPVSPFLVNDIQNLGNTVICRLKFKPSLKLLGIKLSDLEESETVTGFTNVIQGVNTSPPRPNPLITNGQINPSDLPGLSIAIAPQVTTPNKPILEESEDSLPDFLTSFSFDNPTVLEDSPLGNLVVNSIDQIGNKIDTDDRRASCLQPAALVRNAFLATLSELLARDGRFRRSTSVLAVNSYVKNRDGGLVSPPTYIAEKGEDIAEQFFRAPYTLIAYEQFRDGATGYNYPINGVLDVDSGSNRKKASGRLEERLFTLGQLPHCTHLYSGVSRAFSTSYSERKITEPEEFQLSKLFENKSQDKSWQFNQTSIPFLPLPDVLAQLGTVRLCPWNFADFCESATITPDLRGLEALWSGEPVGLKPPGVYPPQLSFGFGSSLNLATRSSLSDPFDTLVLVAHTIDSQFLQSLKDFFQTGPTRVDGKPIRPIRIVLFPETKLDKAIASELYQMTLSEPEGRPGLISIVSIEPCEKNSFGQPIYPSMCPGNTDVYTEELLLDFWKNLLYEPDFQPNIYQRAVDFYKEYLVHTVQIL